MQEHIRRAHPEHYISKLPATEESFQLMINAPPSERSQPLSAQTFGNSGWSHTSCKVEKQLMNVVHGHERDAYAANHSSPAPARTLEDTYPAAATAAVALAQLRQRPDSDWESDAVRSIMSQQMQ